MRKYSVVGYQRILALLSFLLLTSCMGGDESSVSTGQELSQPQQFIDVAGVKGPLAFASVELYELDIQYERLYGEGNPIASATTNAYAQITSLPVPRDARPPYILVIDGSNAIDLNTGAIPVIKQLVTIITQEMLDAMQPVYATPYTTLAYQMLRQEYSVDSNINSLSVNLSECNQELIKSIGFGMQLEADIFATPPIITSDTISLEQQEIVVHYRAAIEALSSLLYEMSLSADPPVDTDALLQRLALDLQSDGVINNSAAGYMLGDIDTSVLSRNPMNVAIANTQYLVKDILTLMDEERALVGYASNVIFLTDDIVVELESASLGETQKISYSSPVNSTTDTLLVTGGVFAAAPVVAGIIFNVDFENRIADTPYTKAQVIEDFNANSNDGSIYGPDAGKTRIVQDPAGNSGHENVLRVVHRAGEFGNAVNFKARFAPDNQHKRGSARFDDVYLAYDIYLSPNTQRMPWHKLPGLGTGTKLEMSHDYSVIPEPEGIISFTALMQSFTSISVPDRPDGSLSLNYYDAEKTQKADWLDTVDPALNKGTNSYVMPVGEWITIVQRVKLNTADSNDAYNSVVDLKDGLAEVWINGIKMSSKTHRWRWTDTMKADGFWFYDYYNNRPDLVSPPSEDQYVYYDNFRVSTTPMTK